MDISILPVTRLLLFHTKYPTIMASSSTTSAIKPPESGEVAEVAAGTERSLSGVTKVQKQAVTTVRKMTTKAQWSSELSPVTMTCRDLEGSEQKGVEEMLMPKMHVYAPWCLYSIAGKSKVAL